MLRAEIEWLHLRRSTARTVINQAKQRGGETGDDKPIGLEHFLWRQCGWQPQRRAAARDGRPDGLLVVRRGRPAATGDAADASGV